MFIGCLALLLAASLRGADSQSDYSWHPELAPEGPMLIVIGLGEQRAYVYRNGVRIGSAPVSTGRPGYETPTGVFTILEKRREHYSNLYDDAPMPFMQRLTWGGVALHAGALPGHPDSHGCVRLPHGFAEKLFAVTQRGMTVLITYRATAPSIVQPGLFTAQPAPAPAAAADGGVWAPERSPHGPISVVLSTRDRRVVVLRNAVEIGRAAVVLEDDALAGTRAFVLLAGSAPEASALVPGRPALRWLELPLRGGTGSGGDDLRDAVASGRLRLDAGFARAVYDALVPGSTLVVSDEPVADLTAVADRDVLQSDIPPADQRR